MHAATNNLVHRMGGFIHCKYEQDSDTKGVVDKVMPSWRKLFHNLPHMSILKVFFPKFRT